MSKVAVCLRSSGAYRERVGLRREFSTIPPAYVRTRLHPDRRAVQYFRLAPVNRTPGAAHVLRPTFSDSPGFQRGTKRENESARLQRRQTYQREKEWWHTPRGPRGVWPPGQRNRKLGHRFSWEMWRRWVSRSWRVEIEIVASRWSQFEIIRLSPVCWALLATCELSV